MGSHHVTMWIWLPFTSHFDRYRKMVIKSTQTGGLLNQLKAYFSHFECYIYIHIRSSTHRPMNCSL